MDEHGYPTVEELAEIADWDYLKGARGWFAHIMSKWKYAADGYWHESTFVDGMDPEPEHVYGISTAGWSGNEDILGAMKENRMLWMTTWYSSRRGGHYEFRVRANMMDPS